MVRFIITYILVFFTTIAHANMYISSHKYNARATGMANTYNPEIDDSTAIFYNSSAISLIKLPTYNFTYADMHSLGLIKNYYFSSAMKYNDDIGMAGAWIYEQVDLDPEIWHQHRLFYGVSYTVYEDIYVGLVPKMIYIKTGIENQPPAWGVAFDGGFLISSQNWNISFLKRNEIILRIGINFKNIYSWIKWNDHYTETRALNLIWWAFNVSFARGIETQIQLQSHQTSLNGLSIGTELFLFKMFRIFLDEEYKVEEVVLRFGWMNQKIMSIQNAFTAGIGILAQDYSLDYALMYENNYFSPTHYFSFGIRK